MRFGPDDKFWVVVDATPESEESDILFEASVRRLELQFKGGLTMAQNPTIFTDEKAAKVEAFGRLTAMRASRAIAQRLRADADAEVPDSIKIVDGEGNVLFQAEIGPRADGEKRR